MNHLKRFEILAGLPGDGPLPEYFGSEANGRYREGFVVRFFPDNNEPWVGNFQADSTTMSQVLEWRSPDLVTVIAQGRAYDVNLATRRVIREFGSGSIEFFAAAPAIDGFVVGNGLWFESLHTPARPWRTRRISWDGMRSLHIDGFVLSGEAYNPMEDRWEPFTVDLRDGTAAGGSYNGPDM